MHNFIKDAPEFQPLVQGVNHAQSEPPEKKPLIRQLPPGAMFPVDSLPPLLATVAKECNRIVQAPLATCGNSVLAAATLATQPITNVVIDGRVISLNEFFVTISESGERKSAVDAVVLNPVRIFEESRKLEYELERKISSREHEVYQAQKLRITKDKNLSIKEMNRQIEALGPEPETPRGYFSICSEPSLEGLVKLLENNPSLGVFSDEGGRFLGGHALNQDNRTKSAAGLNSLWDRGVIDKVRAGEGAGKLFGVRVSMHIMFQPALASMLFADRSLAAQGFLARFLTCMPERLEGRKYVSENIYDQPSVKSYIDQMLRLLNSNSGTRSGLAPVRKSPLVLSTDAKNAYIQFHDGIHQSVKPYQQYEPIREFAMKSTDHVLRIAGTFTLFIDQEAGEISKQTMESAIELTQYYLSESLRITDGGDIEPLLKDAQLLLNWLESQGPRPISLIEMYQRGPNSLRSASKARQLVAILMSHGHLEKSDSSVVYDEKLIKEAFEIA